MHSEPSLSRSDDIDLVTLGRAVWRAKWWVICLSLLAGVITFFALSMMRPVYTSEARILIENEESTYRRPTGDQSAPASSTLDEQAIQSQVQVLTSRDLILKVVDELDLANDPSFKEDAGVSLMNRLLGLIGIAPEKSQNDQTAGVFAEHLSVYQLGKSSVIAVAYTSGDPELAAKAANSLARVYIEWQREAKLTQTRDATAWLRNQIEALRDRVSDSESAVENFRAEEGIYAGSGDVDLTAQQLSELNSKLILAKAQKSEAEARARMIRQMLTENGEIEATSEVLKSGLISALIEQRVQVQRQLAELSATLLPSHPRIQQLNSELADVRAQIREEGRKIARSLENEAQVADARVQSLTGSLKAAKSQASGEGAAEIKLRALEREAKSNRDLLESYLARYRDASARGDVGAVPANATIVSQAYPAATPSFPKKLPITLLVMVAVALVVLAYVMARELIRATAVSTSRHRQLVPRDETYPAPEPVFNREEESKAVVPTEPAKTPEPDEPKSDDAKAEESEVKDAGDSDDEASRENDTEQQIRSVQEVLARFRRPEAAEARESIQDNVKTNSNGNGPAEKSRELARTEDVDSGERMPIPSSTTPSIPIAMSNGAAKPDDPETARMSPLERYLRQRSGHPAAANERPKAEASRRKGDVIRNIDVLRDRFAEQLDTRDSPVALVTPVSASNALPEAIQLARPLAAGGKTVLLLDMAQGSTTVSDFLGLERSPGFNELLANVAAFEDVLRVDSESPLQVIPAGSPSLPVPPGEVKSFVRILDALRQTYDCVVIHSDFDRAEHFASALHGELTTAVALFAPKTISEEENRLADLKELGCRFMLYERAVSAEQDEANSLRQRLAAS
ncbi:exopolysaccharide transport family protein [Methyloligella solikamskensis]|uniref:Wzz/FepE/Etk N-terminal domain-containing protein n=1 Tax=Methyloligella solikamskensis TaxID=1177756 RepID=A0ABW3JBZ4_9HYPH